MRGMAVLACALWVVPVMAQEGVRTLPPDVAVAFVDVQRIALESAAGKAARARLLAASEQHKAALEEKTKTLAAQQEALEKAPETERPRRQRDIDRMNVDIDRYREDADRELRALDGQLFGDVQKKLTPTLREIITERGIKVLFRTNPVSAIRIDPALDITSLVIARLDALETAPPPPAR